MPRDEVADVQDSEIVAMLRERPEEGVRHLLQTHGSKIKWLLKDRFGDVLAEPDLAGVLNAAAFKVLQTVHAFDFSKGTLPGWFWRIAANMARNFLRGELRHAHQDLSYDPADQDRVPACLEDEPPPAKALENLRKAIKVLPDLQRKVVEADLASGDLANAKWLADRYSTTEASIYMARSRARENLRKTLSGRQQSED